MAACEAGERMKRVDGRVDGWTDGRMDGWIAGQRSRWYVAGSGAGKGRGER